MLAVVEVSGVSGVYSSLVVNLCDLPDGDGRAAAGGDSVMTHEALLARMTETNDV